MPDADARGTAAACSRERLGRAVVVAARPSGPRVCLRRDRVGAVEPFRAAAGNTGEQETREKMTALIEKIAGQGGATRQQLRDAAAKPKAGRPKHFVFAFKPPTKQFNLKLSFARSRVSRDEVIEALEQILRELRKAK